MKRYVKLILCWLFLPVAAMAQTDPRAAAILKGVSAKYRSFNVIRAEIGILSENQETKLKDGRSGTLYVQSASNKFRLLLDDQEITSDGKTQWTYLKDEKEVQVNDAASGEGSLNPAKIFVIYEKGYKYLYTGESKSGGRVMQDIELTPLDAKNPFFKIRLSVDKLLKQVKTAVVFNKNGGRSTYVVKSMTAAVKIAPDFFSFNPKQHPGVEVVDLR